jgi:hypothetical protein
MQWSPFSGAKHFAENALAKMNAGIFDRPPAENSRYLAFCS